MSIVPQLKAPFFLKIKWSWCNFSPIYDPHKFNLHR